jgi:hypothetical protein
MRVRIEGLIDRLTAERAAASLRAPAEASAGACLEARYALAAAEMLNLAAAIASIAQGVLAVRALAQWTRERKEWSPQRLRALIEEEMMKRGVIDFAIESHAGFDHLLANANKPCVVEIRDGAAGATYTLLAFADGDTLVLRVE